MRTMTDHPAWERRDGRWRRLLVTDDDGTARVASIEIDATSRESCFTLPAGVAVKVPALATALTALAPVRRYANASLWDAITTAIIRQVVRASHATSQYRMLCASHGARHHIGGTSLAAMPTPE